MLTLYHAPQSRSSSVVTLLDELGALDQVEIVPVTIFRATTNSGAADPRNPHPDGKVPYLVHDGEGIRERAAVMAYLTELFPAGRMGPQPGERGRGSYLSWLAWYQGVMEPVFVMKMYDIKARAVELTFRDMEAAVAHLAATLERQPYLLGEDYSAADLLVCSPFGWIPDALPDVPAIRDWAQRCLARPALARTRAYDEGLSG